MKNPERSVEEIENELDLILGIENNMRTRKEIMGEANAQNMKYKQLEVLLDIRDLLSTQLNNK